MPANTPLPPQAGTVYGVVLNDGGSVERMGSALQEAPYKGAPKAPILYIKPANTLAATNAVVQLPAGADKVEIGATLGVVIGSPACRLDLEKAPDYIAGYAVAADLSLPHASYYRPAIREKCFDGSCVLGAAIAAGHVEDPASLVVRTLINGSEADRFELSGLVRSVPELLRDITEFMTLATGDVLLVGVKWQAPTALPGNHVTIAIDGVGDITFSIDQQATREAA